MGTCVSKTTPEKPEAKAMLVNLYTDLESDEAIHKYALKMKSVKTDEIAKDILLGLRSKFYDIFQVRVNKLNRSNQKETTDHANTPESLNIRFNIYVSDSPHYLKGTTGKEGKKGCQTPLSICNLDEGQFNFDKYGN